MKAKELKEIVETRDRPETVMKGTNLSATFYIRDPVRRLVQRQRKTGG